jgi:hypothetical protein
MELAVRNLNGSAEGVVALPSVLSHQDPEHSEQEKMSDLNSDGVFNPAMKELHRFQTLNAIRHQESKLSEGGRQRLKEMREEDFGTQRSSSGARPPKVIKVY